MKPRFKIFQKENEERTLDVIIYYPVNFAACSFVAHGREGLKNVYLLPYKLACFPTFESYKQVLAMVKPLGAGHVSQVHSTQEMIRYFYADNFREISLVRYIPKRRTPNISHLTGIARAFLSSYEPHGHVGLI